MNVLVKSILFVILVLLFVVSLLFMLNAAKFQAILSKLITNRINATSPMIYESMEGAIDLGLGLDEISNNGKILSWAQQNNPDMLSIDIFNFNGKILYSTAKQKTEQVVAPYLLELLKKSSVHNIQMELDTGFLSTFKLVNNFNQGVGGGSILYSKADYNRQVHNFRKSLFVRSAVIFFAISVLSAIGIMMAFRGIRNYLKGIEAWHDKIANPEGTGPNVRGIDTCGLAPGASENAFDPMDALGIRLRGIERNFANAVQALDSIENSGGSHGCDANKMLHGVHDDPKREPVLQMARPIILIMMGALFLLSIVFFHVSSIESGRFLEPELKKKAQIVALNIDQDLTKAIEAGIPFKELVGVGEYLDSIVSGFDDISHLEVLDSTGETLFQSGQAGNTLPGLKGQDVFPDKRDRVNTGRDESPPGIYRYPVKMNGTICGYINVNMDGNVVGSVVVNIIRDSIVIFIVAMVAGFHIMTALFLYFVMGPIEQLNRLISLQERGQFNTYIQTSGRDSIGKTAAYLSRYTIWLNDRFRDKRNQLKAFSDEALHRIDHIGKRYGLSSTDDPRPLMHASINDVRIPLFLFAFAEALQKSYLPLFVRQFHTPCPWLNEFTIISLPIILWLALVGIAMRFSDRLFKRFTSRHLFLLGVIPAMSGFGGCGIARTMLQFVLWRGATAIGYAMIILGCQGYLRGKNMAGCPNANMAGGLWIIMSATMCGTAIGGILATRIGYETTFLVAAGLVFIAGFAGYHMLCMDAGPGIENMEKKKHGLNGIRMMVENRRYFVFVFFISIPGHILMTGYLWYLVPLYLSHLGSTIAEIGRIMMIYYLLIVVIGKAAAETVNTWNGSPLPVGLWALFSGIGLVISHQWYHPRAVALSVAVLGISHALIKEPQMTLSLGICKEDVSGDGGNPVLSSLGMLEHTGCIIGLMAGALMINYCGYPKTILIAGIYVCVGSLIFMLFFFLTRNHTA